MRFVEATDRFTTFLNNQGHPGPLVWIKPSDLLWFGDRFLLRPGANETAVEEEFNVGIKKGCGVSLEAVARLDQSICCFLLVPKDAEDAALNFVTPPLTMKVRDPLKPAEQSGCFQWWVARRVNHKFAG